MNLIPPFDTFKIEKRAGEYKDFGNVGDDYPLKGVTYPVDYGDIEGYVTEDGALLDLFVGSGAAHGSCGFLRVARPDLPNGEHKFYIHLTDAEEESVLREFGPVVISHGRYESLAALTAAIEPFRERI